MSCHEMNLAPEPFSLIADGKKKFELRLNDEKRQGIRGGDTIIFTNRKDPQKLGLAQSAHHTVLSGTGGTGNDKQIFFIFPILRRCIANFRLIFADIQRKISQKQIREIWRSTTPQKKLPSTA